MPGGSARPAVREPAAVRAVPAVRDAAAMAMAGGRMRCLRGSPQPAPPCQPAFPRPSSAGCTCCWHGQTPGRSRTRTRIEAPPSTPAVWREAPDLVTTANTSARNRSAHQSIEHHHIDPRGGTMVASLAEASGRETERQHRSCRSHCISHSRHLRARLDGESVDHRYVRAKKVGVLCEGASTTPRK